MAIPSCEVDEFFQVSIMEAKVTLEPAAVVSREDQGWADVLGGRAEVMAGPGEMVVWVLAKPVSCLPRSRTVQQRCLSPDGGRGWTHILTPYWWSRTGVLFPFTAAPRVTTLLVLNS